MPRLHASIPALICLFLLSSCGKETATSIQGRRKIRTQEYIVEKPIACYSVLSFSVKAQEKEKNTSFFNAHGGVRYNNKYDTYMYAAPITYIVACSLQTDTSQQNKGFEIDKIKIVIREDSRDLDHSDTAVDTVYVNPVFRWSKTKQPSHLHNAEMRFSHFSSSSPAKVVIVLKDKVAVFKTCFSKSLAPGG